MNVSRLSALAIRLREYRGLYDQDLICRADGARCAGGIAMGMPEFNLLGLKFSNSPSELTRFFGLTRAETYFLFGATDKLPRRFWHRLNAKDAANRIDDLLGERKAYKKWLKHVPVLGWFETVELLARPASAETPRTSLPA